MIGRRAHRGSEFAVECRSRGHAKEAKVFGLVHEGCWLEAGRGFVSAGDHVILTFACSIRAIGRVAMVSDRSAWVAFDPPMHSAVLSHVTARAPGAREFGEAHPRTNRAAASRLRPV